jgi:Response regulator containing CheY-like receiver domain and AraC-type DNA-binding domain
MYRIDFNKLRFLICDDNPHMRRILRTLLHSFGAREAYEAEDGATALEMYSHYVPISSSPTGRCRSSTGSNWRR